MTEQQSSSIADRCRGTCAVVGLGISNLPLVRFLREHGASVTARDRKTPEKLGAETVRELTELGAVLRLGEDYLEDLNEDVIFRSPGLRPDLPDFCEAVRRGAVLTSEMEWFLELTPATVIGVTGSDGKTTTTTLTYLFLEEECRRRGGGRVYVGGNIGRPLLPLAEEMTEADFAVVELSSFQLQDAKVSPARAAITNLSPNHLNWHTGMEEYIAAKKNIFANPGNRMLVTNADNPITAELAKQCGSPVTLFSANGKPEGAERSVYPRGDWILSDSGISARGVLRTSEIRLPGRHNLENYLTAIALTDGLVGADSIEAVARTFTGVPHRLEKIRTVGGVTYYNSSIDSTPTRTAAALSALSERNIRPVVICGGYDKHIPFDPLADALLENAKAAILTGATAGAIREALERRENETGVSLPVRMEPDFRNAVEAARETADEGDTVLLSPACASFDAFRNFEERGETFRRIVNGFSEP